MCYNVTVLPFGMFIYCFNEDFICINTRLSRYFPDTSLLIVFNLCEQIIQHLKVSLSHFSHRFVLAPVGFDRLFYWAYTSSDLSTSHLGCRLPQNIVQASKKVHTEILLLEVYEARCTCPINLHCNCKSAHMFYVCTCT